MMHDDFVTHPVKKGPKPEGEKKRRGPRNDNPRNDRARNDKGRDGGRGERQAQGAREPHAGGGSSQGAPRTKTLLSALPLGGVGEIGANMMVYECGEARIVVDAGVSFGDDATPGIDVITPDTRYIREHAKHLNAVFITHAHEDHVGAVGYLWDDFNGAPVFATPVTRAVIEAKLNELGIKPAKGQLNTVQPKKPVKVGPFTVEFIPVAHSVPEAMGLFIKTPNGNIVHTADYKFDNSPPLGARTDEDRWADVGKEGVLAVFGDSTNVFRSTPAGNEGDLLAHVQEVLEGAKNRVFFAAFASNVGRVLNVAELAVKNGRKVCFLGRTLHRYIAICKTLGLYPKSLNGHVVEAEEVSGLPRNKVFVFASGTQGETEASLTRLAHGADVKGIKIMADDTVVMSSKMIPGNERPILNVINALFTRGAVVFSELNDTAIHVSGHASRPEIKRMYDLLKPTYVVPVHGEPAHLITHARFAESLGYKSLRLANGHKAVLVAEDGMEPHVQQHVYPHGKNYIDGLTILEHDTTLLKDRRKLAYDGVVVAALAVRQSNGELMGDVTLASKGLLDERLQGGILAKAAQAAQQALDGTFRDGRINDRAKAQELVHQAVRRAFKLQRGKAPTILVQVVEV